MFCRNGAGVEFLRRRIAVINRRRVVTRLLGTCYACKHFGLSKQVSPKSPCSIEKSDIYIYIYIYVLRIEIEKEEGGRERERVNTKKKKYGSE